MGWRELRAFLCVAALAGCGRATLRPDADPVTADVARRVGSQVTSPGAIEPALPPGALTDDGLSEDEAVATALWNNPRFAETLGEMGFARADLVQAGLLSNPVLSVLFPLGPKQLEFAVTAPIEALWLRPRRLAVAGSEYDRLAEQLVQSGLDVVRDVRVAFADAWQAEELARLTSEAVRVQDRFVELAEARLRAGDVGEHELSAAKAEATRAREQAVRQTHERTVTRARLHAALGLAEAAPEFELTTPPALPDMLPAIADLVPQALAARPDLRAAEIAIELAGERAGLARAEFLGLSAIVDANGDGERGFEAGPGMQATLPLFDRQQGRIARGHAAIDQAVHHYAAVRNQVAQEVRTAHARFLQAQQALRILHEQRVPEIETILRHVEIANRHGETSLLEVLRASQAVIDARAQATIAAADGQRALAELERSVGRRLQSTRDSGPKPEATP